MNDNCKRLDTLIHTFVEEKNIPIVGVSSGLDNLNQCAFVEMKDRRAYLISHDDIDIINRYFNLSYDTVQKIANFRKFVFDIYEYTNEKTHARLKVVLLNDNTMELSIIGGGLTSLIIKLMDHQLTICIKDTHDEVTTPLPSFDDVDKTLSMTLDLFQLKIIEKLGFDVTDPCLHDFMKFMNIPKLQLLDTYFKDLPFNYISDVELMESLVSDFSLDTNQIKFNTKQIEIPYELSYIISHLIKKVIPRRSDVLKMKQLINLMKFYHYLLGNEKNVFRLSFAHLKRSDLTSNSDLNRVYYSINLGYKLDVHIGYNLKHNNEFYTNVLDPEAPENGTYYMFSSSILKEETLQPSQTFTDNIDYIYTTVLSQIKEHINNVIKNTGEDLTERHLDLFKMAIY